MSGFLPLLALAMSVHACRDDAGDWGTAFVHGALVWGTAVAFITQVLSAFGLLGRVEVAVCWAAFTAAALVIARRRRLRRVPSGGAQPHTGASGRQHPWRDDLIARAQVPAVGLFLFVTLILAFLAAPSAADSMTYHLPRIEHWIQNRTVAPYPSNIQRELWPDPGAEFILLQFEILTGGDRMATVLQWAAYAANVVLAWMLAAQLGAAGRGRMIGAFLAATIPGAVSQATGSQVELVFAFWLSCAVLLGLRTLGAKQATPSTGASALFGAAIGLAVLTKATAYLFFFPFLLWFLAASLRRHGLKAARMWAVAGVCAFVINAPQWYYNVVLYGRPLGQPGANGVVNSSFFPGGTASNVVRNLSLHFGTPFPGVNIAAESAVVALDRKLGVAPDDPRTTFPGERYRFLGRQSAEQTAGSPIHVIIAMAALLFFFPARRTRHRQCWTFMLCLAGGFLLFCFYLRWQPWHARLHVPLLLLSAPAAACAMEDIRRRSVVLLASLLAFMSALPPLLRNPPRLLVGSNTVFTIPREQQYFAEYPRLYPVYRAAADHLESIRCRDIGLWIPGDGAEYPLWALLRKKGEARARIRHISVDNPSAALTRVPRGDRFQPCALVLIESEGRWKPVVLPEGYSLAWRMDVIRIYTPARPNLSSSSASGGNDLQ